MVFLAASLESGAMASLVCAESFTGTFGHDDDQVVFNFLTDGVNPVTMRTWSFAGGINAFGNTIQAGGFAPVLSLFDSSGALIAWDHNGQSGGPVAVDPTAYPPGQGYTGYAWDAYITANLSAGAYTLVLTQDDNTPYGPFLSDGFTRTGEGNFTGPIFRGSPLVADEFTKFIMIGDYQRTGDWAVDICTSCTPIPEPGSVVLLASGLAGLVVVARRRRRNAGPRA